MTLQGRFQPDLRIRNWKRPWARSWCWASTPNRISQDYQKDLLLLERILQDLDTRTSQEPPRRAFMQAPPKHGACTLLMQGPPREDHQDHSWEEFSIFSRISTGEPARLRENLQWKRMKMPHSQSSRTPRRRLCASLRRRHAHGMDLSQESFYARIYRKNAATQDRDAHFVRACALDMHIDMSKRRTILCGNL